MEQEQQSLSGDWSTPWSKLSGIAVIATAIVGITIVAAILIAFH